MAGVLPLPWILDITVDGVQYNLPVAPWLVLTSFFAFVVGLLSYPHVPQCMGVPDICFWDTACINQTDVDQKNKGIYAIADFLRVSKELRVLWSPPYLSSQSEWPNERHTSLRRIHSTDLRVDQLWCQLCFLDDPSS